MVSRFVRKVRTASGAVAVQLVTRHGRQLLGIEHVGSAHTDEELALLLAAATARLMPGQAALDVGALPVASTRMEDVADWTLPIDAPAPVSGRSGAQRRGRERAAPAVVAAPAGQVVATSSRLLWQVLTDAYSQLGFDVLGDEAFRAMALARIVEPTSKADSLRVLDELGAPTPGLRTLFRSLKRCRGNDYRDALAKACAAFSAAAGGLSARGLAREVVDLSDRVLRAPVRPEPVGDRLEVGLQDRFQDEFQALLTDPWVVERAGTGARRSPA